MDLDLWFVLVLLPYWTWTRTWFVLVLVPYRTVLGLGLGLGLVVCPCGLYLYLYRTVLGLGLGLVVLGANKCVISYDKQTIYFSFSQTLTKQI